ncbi:hypothetical protein ACH4RG_30235 [Streptomyces sp. NPDC021019]
MRSSEELRRITMTPAARLALAAAGRPFHDRGVHPSRPAHAVITGQKR